MPRTRRFIDSPELYDAIYRFKNYARECDRLRNLKHQVCPRHALRARSHGTMTSFDAPRAGTAGGHGTFTALVDAMNPAEAITGWLSLLKIPSPT